MKKANFTYLFVFLILTLSTTCIMQSCKKIASEDTLQTEPSTISQNKMKRTILSPERSRELMENFSIILRNALKDDVQIRRFLKDEALKKFDLDYDILYQMVKDKIVSNNETFRQKLLKYVKDEKELIVFEDNLPLLTIYIPELPGGFSAEKWNVENENPGVSTGFVNNEKKITYYMEDGSQFQQKAELVPGFPLLVVKTNERVVLSQTSDARMGKQITNDEFSYAFLSENFNGLSKSNDATKKDNSVGFTTNSYCLNCTIDTKLSTAFDLWEASGTSNFWQRDYIYYSLTPSSPNGALDTRYQEHLTSIKLKHGTEAYNKISDQNDPWYIGPNTGWTEGSFEFNLTVLINNTQGLGSTIKKLFPVDPSSLFIIHYNLESDGWYHLSAIPIQCNVNEVIAAWDIKNNGVAWQVMFSEVDPSQTVTRTETHTSTFATNFSFGLDKIGLKFGNSATETHTSTYSLVTQEGDDDLGNAAMYFYDPVITYFDIIPGNGDASHTFKDVDTGWALLTIQPKRVF